MLNQRVQDLAHSLQETRSALEAEMAARIAGDDEIRRRRSGGDSAPSSSEVQQVKGEINYIKQLFEEEGQARKAGDTISGEACLQIQGLVELERQQRQALAAKLDEQLETSLNSFERKMKDLASALREENAAFMRHHQTNAVPLSRDTSRPRSPMNRDRASSPFREGGGTELERKVRDLRNTMDVEAKERRAADDDIIQRVGGLFVRMEQESNTRDIADSNVRSQIGGWREELNIEKAARLDEEAKIRCNLQRTEVALTEKINESLLERENFMAQFTQIKHKIAGLSSNLDAEIQKKFVDFRAGLEHCERRLGEHADRDLRHKQGEMSETLSDCYAKVKHLSERLENEARERTLADEMAMARVREITVGLEQEKEDREMGDERSRSSFSQWREEFVAERDSRTTESASLRREVQLLSRKSEEAKASLNTNLGSRDIKSEGSLEINEKVKSIGDRLSLEANERRSADEAAARNIQELMALMKQEKGERETGDSSTRTQLVNCLKELVSEKEKRVDDQATLRHLVQALEESVGQQLSDLRLALETEVHVRMQAIDGIDKRGRKNGDESLKLLRQELEEEIKQRVADGDRLRSALQIEVALRETSQEAAKQFNEKLKQLEGSNSNQELLQQEREDRQREDRSLQQLLSSFTEQTNQLFDEFRNAWEEESQRVWEALHTHTHDVHLKGTGEHQMGPAQIQMAPTQMTHMGAAQMGTAQMGTAQMGAAQMGAAQMGAAQMASQMQMGPTDVPVNERSMGPSMGQQRFGAARLSMLGRPPGGTTVGDRKSVV